MPLMKVLMTEATNPVTVETIMDVLSGVTSVITPQVIIGFLAGIIGVAITYVLLWWGVRKGFKSVMKAVTKGKLSV